MLEGSDEMEQRGSLPDDSEAPRHGGKGAPGSQGAAPAASAKPQPVREARKAHKKKGRPHREDDPFIRAENEDDDGYDPYSDRQPRPEPLFERDPWD